MKMCASHWDKLQEAIKARGLWSLVPENSDDTLRALQRELSEGPSIDSYDPLMGAHNAIMGNAIEMADQVAGKRGVMELMTGANCPLCFLDMKHRQGCDDPKCSFDLWITYAADEMVEAWKRLNAG